tara:strand:- start:394 stop:630 length:237 start_codon:yes stop_codon:yes gene_type:complete
MKKLLLELIKVTLLFFCVTIGVIIFDEDPVEAKARKIQDRKGNLAKELSREERDEYMEYLRTLNDFNDEDSIYKKQYE